MHAGYSTNIHLSNVNPKKFIAEYFIISMSKPNFYISKLKVHNFKSFQDLDVDLDRFNIVIGKNASGKTNFKNIFTFLIDAIYDGLPSAISIQGGHEQLLTFNSTDKFLSFELHFHSDIPEPINAIEEIPDQLKTTKIIYKFCIEFTQDMNYDITRDCLVVYLASPNNLEGDMHKFTISKINEKVIFTSTIPKKSKSINEEQPEILKYFNAKEKNLLLEEHLLYNILPDWYDFLYGMATYDLDPKILKSPTIISKFSVLSDDGSNLAYILDHIKHDERETRRLLNHIQDLLPFLETFYTEHRDGKVEFSIKESYSDTIIPAQFISDGTVNIIGLLICMFFDKSSLSIIEEPERNIHPGLLNNITNLMDITSELKQVIITTHNPDIIEYANTNKVLLVNKDEQGNSNLIKLEDHELVKQFKNTMSIHELLQEDLLS